MGARRRGPPVVPEPALGLLLLLLSAPAPSRASPRLLDHPAPVCAQEVRPRGAREGDRGQRSHGVWRTAAGRRGRGRSDEYPGPRSLGRSAQRAWPQEVDGVRPATPALSPRLALCSEASPPAGAPDAAEGAGFSRLRVRG
jgi:hypothetical protein